MSGPEDTPEFNLSNRLASPEDVFALLKLRGSMSGTDLADELGRTEREISGAVWDLIDAGKIDLTWQCTLKPTKSTTEHDEVVPVIGYAPSPPPGGTDESFFDPEKILTPDERQALQDSLRNLANQRRRPIPDVGVD